MDNLNYSTDTYTYDCTILVIKDDKVIGDDFTRFDIEDFDREVYVDCEYLTNDNELRLLGQLNKILA